MWDYYGENILVNVKWKRKIRCVHYLLENTKLTNSIKMSKIMVHSKIILDLKRFQDYVFYVLVKYSVENQFLKALKYS